MNNTPKPNFHESYGQDELLLPPDWTTGLVFATIALIVALLFYEIFWVAVPALAAAIGFAAVSLVRPSLLRPLNIAWMKFAGLLNFVVSPVVLGLMYVIAIVPAGLLMQLFRDPLLRRRPKVLSYWIAREDAPATLTSMKNQF